MGLHMAKKIRHPVLGEFIAQCDELEGKILMPAWANSSFGKMEEPTNMPIGYVDEEEGLKGKIRLVIHEQEYSDQPAPTVA